jgi:hypothetical protein
VLSDWVVVEVLVMGAWAVVSMYVAQG